MNRDRTQARRKRELTLKARELCDDINAYWDLEPHERLELLRAIKTTVDRRVEEAERLAERAYWRR